MKDVLENALLKALAGMTDGPGELLAALKFYANQEGARLANVEASLSLRIRAGANDPVKHQVRKALSDWDYEQDASWTKGTPKLTGSRRERIYELLRAGRALREALDELPYYKGPTEVLIENPASAGTWYTQKFRATHDFYWKRLEKYLIDKRELSSDDTASLGSKASRVLAHLADPGAAAVWHARGLVVGHVQSGKTTNFTAVIAKAIDAGYRLIIVLSGTTNLLRNQTQRRLDMELAGRENVLRRGGGGDHDYSSDPDWPDRFISYGRLPSLAGSVDILRLTGREDFQSQSAGINPMEFEFEKREKLKPLFDRENLDQTNARLVVVKKQKDRLKKLCTLLEHVGEESCSEIPALMIDDESDQASVNTVNPSRPRKQGDDERTRINGYIVKILKLLPRAQYIGYTATPFANCFVNPDDPADLYPTDFILSLERPPKYMGARDFHDFDPVPSGRLSNEKAHVRDIPCEEAPKDDRLGEAIDAFVLTAAIKEFRAARHKDLEFRHLRHHTMLVHDSPLTGKHEATANRIRRLWRSAGYDSPAAAGRLWEMLGRDYRPVWQDRGGEMKLPSSLAQLKTYLGLALQKIRKGEKDPVLVVNSAEGADVPDFDKGQVWKIIVGGTKLSRGYTVEGLTISYFRRRAANQDTLMQMGRWFGFRHGYRDLIRLYIGRKEPDGKRPPFDLYKAFEAMCRDEEDFREQLKMYELGPDGRPGLTPRDIPALIFNSHPRLRPTAANKMFNAKITWAAFHYREPTQQSMDAGPRSHNERAFKALLGSTSVKTVKASVEIGKKSAEFDVRWRPASTDQVVELLKDLDWGLAGRARDGRGLLSAELAFLERKPSPVGSWLIVVPQLLKQPRAGDWRAGKNSYRKVEREWQGSRFGGFSSPEHVSFAKWLVGKPPEGHRVASSGLKQDKSKGILLVYPTAPTENGRILKGPTVMGFALVLPDLPTGSRVAFTTYRKSEEVVVAKGKPAGAPGPAGRSRAKQGGSPGGSRSPRPRSPS
jgi:hypothetical protein